MIVKRSMVAVTEETWAPSVPDWIHAMAAACDDNSQTKVAKEMGVSVSVVSQTLANSYRGNLANIEERARGAFMNATVNCPKVGNLPLANCLAWRNRAKDYSARNSFAAQMFRACNRCPVNAAAKAAREEKTNDQG